MPPSPNEYNGEKGKGTQSALDEKRPASEFSSDHGILDGDEALHLVGAERTAQFSEEYNLKLRRKLVSNLLLETRIYYDICYRQDLLIPPLCAAVYFTQFLDKTSLNYARYVSEKEDKT